MGTKAKPRVSDIRFVEVYQESATAQEVANKLGLTLNSVYMRANKLRALGADLKDGFERKQKDIAGLNEFIARLGKQAETDANDSKPAE